MIRLMTKEKENKSPNISDRTLEIGDREKSEKIEKYKNVQHDRCHSENAFSLFI